MFVTNWKNSEGEYFRENLSYTVMPPKPSQISVNPAWGNSLCYVARMKDGDGVGGG